MSCPFRTVEHVKKNLEVAKSRREQEDEALKRAERLEKLKARKLASQTQISDTRAAIGKLHVQTRTTHVEIAAVERDQELLHRKIEEHDSKVVILEAYERQLSRLQTTLHDYHKRLKSRLDQLLPKNPKEVDTQAAAHAMKDGANAKCISEAYEAICAHLETISKHNKLDQPTSDIFNPSMQLPSEIEAQLSQICESPSSLRSLVSHLALVSKVETERLERSTEKLDLLTLEEAALARLEKDTFGQASQSACGVDYPSTLSSSSSSTTSSTTSSAKDSDHGCSASSFPTVEELLEKQRQEHVSRFLSAEKALNSAHALRKQRDDLLDSSGRMASYVRDLAEISQSSENLDPNAPLVVPGGSSSKAFYLERLQNMELSLSMDEAAYEKSCEIVERLKLVKKRFEKDLRALKDKFERIQELDVENRERQEYCQELLRVNGTVRKVFEAQTKALVSFVSSNLVSSGVSSSSSSSSSPSSSSSASPALSAPYPSSAGEDLSGALVSRELSSFLQLRSSLISPSYSISPSQSGTNSLSNGASSSDAKGGKQDGASLALSQLIDALHLRAHQSMDDLVSAVSKSLVDVGRMKAMQTKRKMEIEKAVSEFAQLNDEKAIKTIEDKAVALEKTHTEVLVPILEENMAQIAKATEHCASIQQLFKDFVEQPAQHLVPWLKIDGQNYEDTLKTWKTLYHDLRQQRQQERK